MFVPSATLENVKKQFPATDVSLTDELVEILITAIVCQYFKLKFADQQINWNLVVKKALGWVKKEADKSGLGTLDFEASASNYLKVNSLA
jgi:hypothetical protein